jgi:hypothetical protein
VNLRFLLSRRQADSFPLLPDSETENRRAAPGRPTRADLEERLERLLTPTELDDVAHRRLRRS